MNNCEVHFGSKIENVSDGDDKERAQFSDCGFMKVLLIQMEKSKKENKSRDQIWKT